MSKINILKLAEDTNEFNGEIYSFGLRKSVSINKKHNSCKYENRKNCEREMNKKKTSTQICISKKNHERKKKELKDFQRTINSTEKELSKLENSFLQPENNVDSINALSLITF